jgi:hypothetical protein
VQGKLRQSYLSVAIETSCVHCNQALHITIDSNMKFSVRETGSTPLVFMPDVSWKNFSERTILDAY